MNGALLHVCMLFHWEEEMVKNSLCHVDEVRRDSLQLILLSINFLNFKIFLKCKRFFKILNLRFISLRESIHAHAHASRLGYEGVRKG